MIAPTLLGHIGAVSGANVSVRQFEGLSSGIAIIGGRSYRIGQVGSFVRIPQGYHDLFGVIAEVGASATPETLRDATNRGDRWMTVQLVGESVGVSFERGISQYPAINDEVHLVTDEDLAKIYGDEGTGQVVVGRLAGAESIEVPYWAIGVSELLTFLMGKVEDKAVTSILDRIIADKMNLIENHAFAGVDPNALTADSPLPFPPIRKRGR